MRRRRLEAILAHFMDMDGAAKDKDAASISREMVDDVVREAEHVVAAVCERSHADFSSESGAATASLPRVNINLDLPDDMRRCECVLMVMALTASVKMSMCKYTHAHAKAQSVEPKESENRKDLQVAASKKRRGDSRAVEPLNTFVFQHLDHIGRTAGTFGTLHVPHPSESRVTDPRAKPNLWHPHGLRKMAAAVLLCFSRCQNDEEAENIAYPDIKKRRVDIEPTCAASVCGESCALRKTSKGYAKLTLRLFKNLSALAKTYNEVFLPALADAATPAAGAMLLTPLEKRNVATMHICVLEGGENDGHLISMKSKKMLDNRLVQAGCRVIQPEQLCDFDWVAHQVQQDDTCMVIVCASCAVVDAYLGLDRREKLCALGVSVRRSDWLIDVLENGGRPVPGYVELVDEESCTPEDVSRSKHSKAQLLLDSDEACGQSEMMVELDELLLKRLHAVFSRLSSIYEILDASPNDTYRARHYKQMSLMVEQCLASVEKSASGVVSLEQLSRHTRSRGGLTLKELDEIREIVQTDTCSRLQELEHKNGAMIASLEGLEKIHGVGAGVAKLWYRQGIRTVGDVRERLGSLNLSSAQRIGLSYYEELCIRIPREEVAEIEAVVRQAVAVVSDHQLHAAACGSYRRGEQSCGDVDVLISGTNGHAHGFLQRLVEHLKQTGFLVETLQKVTAEHEGHDKTRLEKWFGICRLPFAKSSSVPGAPIRCIARRLDLFVVSNEVLPYAQLYLTGDTHFNRGLRLLAKRKYGLRLGNTGMWRVTHDRRGNAISRGPCVPACSEADVLRELGLDFVPPTDRIGWRSGPT
ncbi:DNA polymerase lambda [Porphyridium purpureum]|uniref:DNA polymerase lambda n=1 Tax=Porphyridium purpureum TaxID=35688 RepID=A0A5J4YMS2_PORPP|nr:DNA polymerase lambda [Porphyridium purpureum]|eukprot:POR6516..scf246_12